MWVIESADAQRLLAWYAVEGPRSARSTLGSSGGDAGHGILLTVAVVVGRTPRAYRLPDHRSILDAWCNAYRLESDVRDEMAAAEARWGRGHPRLRHLERARELAGEQVYGWQRDHRYELALDWMAHQLGRRLASCSEDELIAWGARLGRRLSA